MSLNMKQTTQVWLPSLRVVVMVSFGLSVITVVNVFLHSRQYLTSGTKHPREETTSGVGEMTQTAKRDVGILDYSYEDFHRPKTYKSHETFCALHRQQELVPSMFSTFVYNDDYKLVYCSIPKVGCTNWAKVFLVLSGYVNATSASDIPSGDVHKKYTKGLKKLSTLPINEIKRRLDTYFKFVFTRNPFERLLSAYLNKFKSPNPYFHRRYGKRIASRYRPQSNSTSTGSDVTFLEYLQYVTDYDRGEGLNGHWGKMVQFCHPCLVGYDFVGPMDTMESASDIFLDKLGVPKAARLPRRSATYKHSKTNNLLREYFKRIPPAVLDKIVQLYYPDFLMFNLTIPKSIRNLNRWKLKI